MYDESLLSTPLNTLQQLALDLVVNKRRNVFITGSAGVGKSFVLKRIVAELRLRERNVAVTASTGVAALNVEGSTLHSFAGLSSHFVGTTKEFTVNIESAWRYKKVWRDLDVLVIDEISMINSVYFDALERAVSRMREHGEGEPAQTKRPFGGVQLVIVGDFLQLPPVIKDNVYRGIGPVSNNSTSTANVSLDTTSTVPAPTAPVSTSTSTASNSSSSELPSLSVAGPNATRPRQKVGMCFEADSWHRCIDHVIELSEVIRQKDASFVKMLNEIRYGECSEETIRTLNRLAVPAGNNNNNNNHHDQIGTIGNQLEVKPTRLFTVNRAVNDLNEKELAALPDKQRTFSAETEISIPGWRSMERQFYTQLKNALLKDMNGGRALEAVGLKTGAQVVLVKNITKSLVNGSRGVVVGWERVEEIKNFWDIDWINEDLKKFPHWLHANGNMLPIVKFDSGRRVTIGPIVFKINGPHGSMCLRCQIPLQLAWAASVHRCQGTTLTNQCIVNLSRVWEPGQVYVALSRVTCMENLRIVSLDPRKSIFAHEKAKRFYLDVRKNQHDLDKLIANMEPLEVLKPPSRRPPQQDQVNNSFLPSQAGRKRVYSEIQAESVIPNNDYRSGNNSKRGTTYGVYISNWKFKKVYAVARGRKPGLFGNWDDCKAQVDGFLNARYKSFPTIREAEQFLKDHGLRRSGM